MKKEENNLTILWIRVRFKSYFLQIIYGSHYHHHYHPISSCPKLLEPILMEHRVSNDISYLGHSFCTLDWLLWQWQRFILNICMGRNYVGSSYLYLKYGWDYYRSIHVPMNFLIWIHSNFVVFYVSDEMIYYLPLLFRGHIRAHLNASSAANRCLEITQRRAKSIFNNT